MKKRVNTFFMIFMILVSLMANGGLISFADEVTGIPLEAETSTISTKNSALDNGTVQAVTEGVNEENNKENINTADNMQVRETLDPRAEYAELSPQNYQASLLPGLKISLYSLIFATMVILVVYFELRRALL